MKKIVLLFAFIVSGTVLSYAQPYNVNQKAIKKTNDYNKIYIDKENVEALAAKSTHISTPEYFKENKISKGTFDEVKGWWNDGAEETVGKYNDSTYVIVSENHSLYLGELRKDKQGNVKIIRDGWGVARYVPWSHKESDGVYEYYIGPWSSNFKHGEAYYLNADGSMYAGVWKYGKLKEKTRRINLTEEEQQYVKACVARINGITINKK